MRWNIRNTQGMDRDLRQASSIMSKLVGSGFFLTFGCAGLFFIVMLIRELISGKAQWPLALFIIIPLVFVFIGFGGLYMTWFAKPKDESKTPKAKVSTLASKQKTARFIGSIFVLIGAIVFYFLGVRPLWKSYQAQQWVETPCTIVSAEVGSHSSDDGTTYSIDITYTYELNGHPGRSDRYDFIGGSSSGYDGKKAVVDRYKNMTDPVCYVNPAQISEAVLMRDLSLRNAIAFFPLIFIVVGFIVFVAVGRSGQRGKRMAWLPKQRQAPSQEPERLTDFTVPTSGAPAESITLASTHSPLGKLVGITVFCLFWNGIISVFVFQVVQGFRSGRPPWFMAVFMIPFVLIGIGVMVAVVYQLLALANPRYTLTLLPGELHPGTMGQLQWQTRGRAERVQSLKITLGAREEATYRVGTNTRTAKNDFFEMELINTQDPPQIRCGDIGFGIPAETMHSFEAANNKIVWLLKVHGDIARWPDTNQEHKLIVAPHPLPS